MSSGHDVAIVLMDSLQLGLPVQDLHKTEPANILTDGEAHKAPALPEGLLATNGY